MAKPMKTLGLHYPMIQFLIINNYWIRFSHDIMNYQNRGLCYLPKPKASADNTDLGSASADNTDLGFHNS